jgi:hypothetical protein
MPVLATAAISIPRWSIFANLQVSSVCYLNHEKSSFAPFRLCGLRSISWYKRILGIYSKTVEHLAADGEYELAASLLESSGDRFERSAAVANAKRLVYLKLMEKHQNTDPFKFIIYSGKIGEQTPQMPVTK